MRPSIFNSIVWLVSADVLQAGVFCIFCHYLAFDNDVKGFSNLILGTFICAILLYCLGIQVAIENGSFVGIMEYPIRLGGYFCFRYLPWLLGICRQHGARI